MRPMRRRRILSLVVISAVTVLTACGEAIPGDPQSSGRSIATGAEQIDHLLLTEADAGRVIEAEMYVYDIGLPDKKGIEVQLEGDDGSTLRWSFAEKPDSLIMEWYGVDGQLAFETDGLIGNPATATKVLELRGNARGDTAIVLELVERDPAKRSGEPAKRLAFTFNVKEPPGEGWRPVNRATGPRGTQRNVH